MRGENMGAPKKRERGNWDGLPTELLTSETSIALLGLSFLRRGGRSSKEGKHKMRGGRAKSRLACGLEKEARKM